MGPMLFPRLRPFFQAALFQDLDMRHHIAVKYRVLESCVAKIKTDGDHEKAKVTGKLSILSAKYSIICIQTEVKVRSIAGYKFWETGCYVSHIYNLNPINLLESLTI